MDSNDLVILAYFDVIIMPPFEKGGAYCFAPVGRYVCRYVGSP